MGTLHTDRLARHSDENIFLQLEDEETSNFEKHVRFSYAIYSVLGHINRNYHRFGGEVPSAIGLNARMDFNIWYPKQGKPSILSTLVESGPINIAQLREFKADPMYKDFELACVNPPRSLALALDSSGNGTEDFGLLIKIFHKACNDESWRYRVPKFLRASAAR